MNKENVFVLLSRQAICALLGQRAKRLRLAQNVSQKELAARAGLSFGTVRNLEAGKSISLEHFVGILEALGRIADLENVLAYEPSLSIQQLEKLEQAGRRQRATRQGAR